MSPVGLDELLAYAQSVDGGHAAGPAQSDLTQAYEEYLPRRRTGVAPFALWANGAAVPSFYALLSPSAAKPERLDLVLTSPTGLGPPWEFLPAFEALRFSPDGSVEVVPPDGSSTPRRAIARMLVRDHFLLRSPDLQATALQGKPLPPVPLGLPSPPSVVEFVRTSGIVPFSMSILLYLPDERLRVDIDLLQNQLLSDVRAGRLAATRRVRRTARLAHGLDTTVARGDLPLLSARMLEVIFETHGLTAIELAHIFGGLREVTESSLQELMARHLVSHDPRTGVYRARLDEFVTPTDRTVPLRKLQPSASNPALRASVLELISATDSRSICPLCGEPLVGSPKAIVCDRCAAEVGAG